jgi:membrane dipeptidase
LIVDAHNDLLLELAFRAHEPNPFAAHWLDQLRQGQVELQVCPVSAPFQQLPEAALREALDQVVACLRAVAENAGEVALVETRGDLDAIEQSGRLGLILSMEGAEPLGYTPRLVDAFWKLGLRMFSLTWNRRNPFADGVGEPPAGGLSRLGRELVDRLAERGAMIDLAHASERTFFDVLERAEGATVVVSHAGCRALVDTPRNLRDEQLQALAERGGVLGVMALPLVVEPPTVDAVVDHFEHAVAVMGINHVGVGADFFQQVALSGAVRKPPDSFRPPGVGLDAAIEGLSGPAEFPHLVAALRVRGFDGERLEALLRGNLLRIFREALPV